MRDLYSGRHLFRFLRLKMSNIQLLYICCGSPSSLHPAMQARKYLLYLKHSKKIFEG